MLLYRLGPEGFYAVRDEEGVLRALYSDPYDVRPGGWEFGREIEEEPLGLLAPVAPGKIVGVGCNYRDHAAELGNEMPSEPLLFLKAPSSVIGHRSPIVLPPESERVEFEGEIAVVVRHRLTRADAEQARAGILGVTCACDVTARDLQRRDATFARGKSFDSFCPLGPAIQVEPDLESLEVVTRLDGEERQRGQVNEMAWDPVAQLVYISRMMTLEPGDVVLTGTPAGVGRLEPGQALEVEVSSVGVLENRVEARVE
ncbi:MAG: fumarylacetoacetate hydrolase family protein [Acidobacteria bacterium]|nr:fumarylacetoacetate hydrolase family protein [Acidobacteriota bacterium]